MIQTHQLFRRTIFMLAAMFSLTAMMSPAAHAWHDEGHYTVSFEAVVRLPSDVPVFFRASAPTVAHMAIDPDVARHPDAKQLRSAIAPEHYIDLELLQGKPLPPDRYKYIELCKELNVSPKKAGMLPYAIVENTERLMLAFAEHRKWPNDPAIQAKCLIYAGILSHYTADLCMPLHTTLHFNGMAKEDGSSPATGIHDKVDALLGKWPAAKWNALRTPAPVEIGNNWTYVLGELARSNDRVKLVYSLESVLPGVDEPIGDNPDLNIFVFEAAHRATSVTAQLIYAAWTQSATIQLEDIHDRAIERASADVTAAEPPTLPDVENPAVELPSQPAPLTDPANQRDISNIPPAPALPPALPPAAPAAVQPPAEEPIDAAEPYVPQSSDADDSDAMRGITIIEVESESVEDQPTK